MLIFATMHMATLQITSEITDKILEVFSHFLVGVSKPSNLFEQHVFIDYLTIEIIIMVTLIISHLFP
jgi:hypothetical protein